MWRFESPPPHVWRCDRTATGDPGGFTSACGRGNPRCLPPGSLPEPLGSRASLESSCQAGQELCWRLALRGEVLSTATT